jgi:hypothetical protein
VTGAQFQDRTAQHLKHVVGAIETLREAVEAMQRDSGAALPDLAAAGEVDEELLQQLLSRQTLSAVQRRFVARLSGKAADSSVEDAPAGDVDLF